MKSGNPVLLALLLAFGPAMAAEDVDLGPWRLGMSKEQVVAFADLGPYEDAPAGGAVTTAKAKFAKHKAEATLVFADDALRSIEMKAYEGKEWFKARDAALEVYDQFAAAYGGANVKEVTDRISRKDLEDVLGRTLGTAESMNKQYAARQRSIVVRYDMVPLRQPAGSRLHCQWVYLAKSDTYQVFIFQDAAGVPSRDAEDNIVTEKL